MKMLFEKKMVLLLFLTVFNLNAQSWNNPFTGIKDIRTLPILKNFGERSSSLSIKPEVGRLIYDLILEHSYEKGLEIGTAKGYSTLWIALALKKNKGKLTTIEINHEKAREAQKNFNQAHLNSFIDLRINDAFKEISKLDNRYDFIFIDGWKKDHNKFFKLLKYRIRRGGMIIVRDVLDESWRMHVFVSKIKRDSTLKTRVYRNPFRGVLVSIKK